MHLYPMAGESLDGFSTNRVARHHGRRGHAAENRQGEVPWRNDGTDTQRDVAQLPALARQPGQRLLIGKPEHLAPVELGEVDRLGDIPVRLGQDLPTSKIIQAASSCLRRLMMAAARNSRSARFSAGTLFQDSKAVSAACIACSACALPALQKYPTTSPFFEDSSTERIRACCTARRR